jgi:hypothetical protein
MMDSSKNNLSDPESLLGMLQRGRGKGCLDALGAAPETVWPLLFECVTHDPRLDPLLEEREAYYASLIASTGMDLEPFRAYLVQNDVSEDVPDWHTGLFLATLGTLAGEWQHIGARQILRDYVSYGRKWPRVMELLADVETPAALEQSVAALCRRVNRDAAVLAQFRDEARKSWKWYCGGDEDSRAEWPFFLPVCEPWKTMCEHNKELADLFAGAGIAYDQPPPPEKESSECCPGDLPLEELFSRVDESNCTRFWRFLPEKVSPDDEDYLLGQLSTGNPQHMILAFRGLGHLGTPRALNAVRSYIEASENADRKVRRRAFDAIEEMPASLTLDLARQWFRRKEWYLHVPAGCILERHAALEDVSLLIEALRTPETVQCEDSRLGSALRTMARFDGIGPIAELEQVFCQVQDCYRRYEAAQAMKITAPVEFASTYAFECLWDCHDDTRALGCEMVNLSTPRALERIREIATEGNDNDDVQQAAAKRLKGF